MPSFTDEIRVLESPIDVMYLMHKVFMAHSERTEALAEKAQGGGDITDLKDGLDVWLSQLLYHTKTEDIYMTGPLRDAQLQDGRKPLRENEKEHDELRQIGANLTHRLQRDGNTGLTSEVTSLVLAMEEKDHAELMKKVEEVEKALSGAIGEEQILARTRRHLYRSVMSFKVTEFDHFENEEAFVMPLVKDQMDHSQQLECVRRLLFDDESDNPRWIIDFVTGELEGHERKLLEKLETEFSLGV